MPSEALAGSAERQGAGVASAAGGLSGGRFIPLPPTDLFGEPIVPKRGPGRPRHVPTEALRGRVAQLRAEGLNQEQIAKAIGLTVPTMHRHYHLELGSASQAWRVFQPKES